MLRLLAALSILLFCIRVWAGSRIGFGDSEALYASWAAHPQAAYLDHPGLLGAVARVIGEGAVPTPERAHLVTAVAATLLPWLVVGIARLAGAKTDHAAGAGFVFALVPEIAVGLFALTPDLLLAPLWLGAMGLAMIGMQKTPSDLRSASALLGAGLLAGMASAAKVSGLLLLVALAVTYVRVPRLARSVWPWAGLLAGIIVIAPIALFESRTGWPMLRHRFVDTQHDAGLALKNLGALAGGQLIYLSPVVLWLAVLTARDLVRQRNADDVSKVLFWSFAIPLAPLTILCLWSPHAEPHWIAPPLLALPIHAARRVLFSMRRVQWAAAVAAGITLLAHVYVLVPATAKLFPSDADPKFDIASELYGWPTAIEHVREQMKLAATPSDPEGREVVVVGPHWTICAQLHAALPGVRVGCATPIPDDFDHWLPRDVWRHADNVLFVTDNRFPGDGSEQLPALVPVAQSRIMIPRGGHVGRVFQMYLYSRRQKAELR
jgi:hypothetical protein